LIWIPSLSSVFSSSLSTDSPIPVDFFERNISNSNESSDEQVYHHFPNYLILVNVNSLCSPVWHEPTIAPETLFQKWRWRWKDSRRLNNQASSLRKVYLNHHHTYT
jgi:hypothetical protein